MTAMSWLDRVQHEHDIRESIREQRSAAKKQVRQAKSALRRAKASGNESLVASCEDALAFARQYRNELLWHGRHPQIH